MEKTVECGKADAVDLLFLFSLLGCLIFATPWSVVHQAPLSMGFSRQEYLSGLPFLSPGDLPNQGLKCIFCISCIGRWTLHHWVPREALLSPWVSEVKSLSHVWPFATPWTVAYQVPPSMGFSRQEYWSGLPFPSPGDLPYPGIEPGSPTW